MKKHIVKIGTLAMMLLMAFGCEKRELGLAEAEEAKEQKFAVVTQLTDLKGQSQKAIIVGTKDELKAALMKDEPALLKKVAKMANILVPTGTIGPVGPTPNPHEACWDEIMAFRDAHIAEWQALANQHCQPVFRCIGCDIVGGGMAVDFIIHPNSRKCFDFPVATFEELFNLTPFNFGEADYDSGAVLEFIKNAK